MLGYRIFEQSIEAAKWAARIMLSANRGSPSVQLFNELKWILFMKKLR